MTFFPVEHESIFWIILVTKLFWFPLTYTELTKKYNGSQQEPIVFCMTWVIWQPQYKVLNDNNFQFGWTIPFKTHSGSIPRASSSRAVLISRTFFSRESRSLVWADRWLVTVSCSVLCWTQVPHMGQLLSGLKRSCSTLNCRSSTLASRVVGLDGGTGHFIEPLIDMEWMLC